MAKRTFLQKAGFRNIRQVLAKVGKSNIARAVNRKVINEINNAGPAGGGMAAPETMKKGGIVRRTGYCKVHKGELIIPAGMVRKLRIRKR